MSIKTQLEWAYQPKEFFEATYQVTLSAGDLVVDDGKATYTLSKPADPVADEQLARLAEKVDAIFSARCVLTHHAYGLNGPAVIQHHPEGRRTVAKTVGVGALLAAGTADVVVRDAEGKVVADSKAARVASEAVLVTDLASKALGEPTLRRMLQSYKRSTEDPANELVHLYEIRDAVAKHFGKEAKALSALGVSKKQWQQLGLLANETPLSEGRHRAKNINW